MKESEEDLISILAEGTESYRWSPYHEVRASVQTESFRVPSPGPGLNAQMMRKTGPNQRDLSSDGAPPGPPQLPAPEDVCSPHMCVSFSIRPTVPPHWPQELAEERVPHRSLLDKDGTQAQRSSAADSRSQGFGGTGRCKLTYCLASSKSLKTQR